MSHPTALAEQAATNLHELAHLTRPAITTLHIDELRTLTGALTELAAGLPQTLHQLSSYLHTTDNLTSTGDQFNDPQAAVDHARTCLRHASTAAVHLAATLAAAHQTLGDMTETTKSEPRGSIFNRR